MVLTVQTNPLDNCEGEKVHVELTGLRPLVGAVPIHNGNAQVHAPHNEFNTEEIRGVYDDVSRRLLDNGLDKRQVQSSDRHGDRLDETNGLACQL